jgi:NAD(P)-dependent dehydrogenase (short-subunit alcohol dehydrogenase family)
VSSPQAVAVIAGASSGLGSALCSLLIQHGFQVAIFGREPALRAVVDEVPGVMAIACELASETEVERAFAAVEALHGAVSVVVYNAHHIQLRSETETSAAMFEASWRAGCLGAFIVAKRSLARMVARGGGTIIFSGATASMRGGKRSAAFFRSQVRAARPRAISGARVFAPRDPPAPRAGPILKDL